MTQANKTKILLAVIALVSAITVALFSNWEKVFPVQAMHTDTTVTQPVTSVPNLDTVVAKSNPQPATQQGGNVAKVSADHGSTVTGVTISQENK